jgi:hypothetical protein
MPSWLRLISKDENSFGPPCPTAQHRLPRPEGRQRGQHQAHELRCGLRGGQRGGVRLDYCGHRASLVDLHHLRQEAHVRSRCATRRPAYCVHEQLETRRGAPWWERTRGHDEHLVSTSQSATPHMTSTSCHEVPSATSGLLPAQQSSLVAVRVRRSGRCKPRSGGPTAAGTGQA